jgi:hypothetical protein
MYIRELHNMCSYLNIIRELKEGGWRGRTCSMQERLKMREKFCHKLEYTRELGRTKRRWLDNIKIGLKMLMREVVD